MRSCCCTTRELSLLLVVLVLLDVESEAFVVLMLAPLPRASLPLSFVQDNRHNRHRRLLGSSFLSSTMSASTSGKSLRQLLQELDDRGIRYPATASRNDLEALLVETETTLSAEDLDLIQRKQIERGERRRRRMKQQLQRPSYTSFRRGNNHQPVLFFREMVAERVPQMVQRSKRRAAKLQRWFSDFLALDEETGVRDVKYQYIGNFENRINRNSNSSSSKNSPSDRMSEKKRDNDVIDVSAQIVQEIKIKTSQPIRRSVSNSNEKYIDNVVEGGVPLPKSTRKGPKSEANGENQQSSHETYRSDSTANTFKSQRSGYHENWVREVRQPPPLQPRNQRPRPTMLNNQSQPMPPSRKASKSNERSEVPNNLNTINIYRLPPPENWQPKVDNLESSGQDSYRRMSQRQQHQRRSVARQKPKKVYSPYKRSNTFYNTNGEKYDDRDVVDRMGDFLADTAEEVFKSGCSQHT